MALLKALCWALIFIIRASIVREHRTKILSSPCTGILGENQAKIISVGLIL